MGIKKDKGYVRVSTQKISQQDSPEHQESFIRKSAAQEGVMFGEDDFYEDRDTATSIIDREDVKRMIEDAKRGDIKSIWFASLSRFSRDALDAISLKRILVNALKIRVVSIEDGYDSAKKDDELLFGVKSFVNQNTSGDISTSSRRGIDESAEAGNYIGSIPPYGYKKIVVDDPRMKSGKRKTLESIPEQAKVVKAIFDMYANQGMGEKAIVDFLNGDEGKREPIPSYKGGVWGLSSIQRILQNEIYTGHNVHGRHTIEIAYDDLTNLMNRRKKLVQKPKSEWKRSKEKVHPAIISCQIFEQAQDIRLLRGGSKKGGRRTFVNVFAKMIFCKHCGSAMVSMKSKTQAANGKEYRYLMCSRRRRTGQAGCPNGKWIPYFDMRDELIAEILDRVSKAIKRLESKGVDDLDTSIPANDFEKDKRKLEKRIEDNRKLLFEIRRQNMLGDLAGSQYEFEKEQYEKEIEEAEKKLNLIRVRERKSLDMEKIMREAKASLKQLTKLKTYDDVEKTRVLLMQMVKRIEVDQDGEIEVQTTV